MQCCPNCGVNLKKFESQSFGNISINEKQELVYAGQVVKLYPASKQIVIALVRGQGRIMQRDAFANILDFEGDVHGGGNAINTYIVRARRAFEAIDPSFDQIVTHYRLGYSWQFKPACQLALAA